MQASPTPNSSAQTERGTLTKRTSSAAMRVTMLRPVVARLFVPPPRRAHCTQASGSGSRSALDSLRRHHV